MSEIIPIIGTKTCTFPLRTPTQSDADAYLNIDEGMASKSALDLLRANAIGQVVEVLLGPVTFTGPFEWNKVSFYYDGAAITNVPGIIVEVFLDGQPAVTAVSFRTVSGTAITGQALFTSFSIVGLTGLMWNAATERTAKVTTLDAGLIVDIPPEFNQEN